MATMIFAVEIIGAGTILLLTISTLTLRIRELIIRERDMDVPFDPPELYTCDDGAATEESEARYSAVVKTAVFIVLVGTLLGCSTALADAVLYSLHSSSVYTKTEAIEAWMRTFCWILALLLATCVTFMKSSSNIYGGSVRGAVTLFIITLLSATYAVRFGLLDNALIFGHSSRAAGSLKSLLLCSGITGSIAGIIAAIAFLSIPRRPDIYTEKGRVVDREHTVSAVSRYTLRWCEPLLDLAASKTMLDLTDLPSPSHATRAQTVYQAFLSSVDEGDLWKRILFAHLPSFLLQWFLTLLQSAMQFVPQLSMYKLLQQLELRQDGNKTDNTLILWCIALGFGLLLNEWVQSWLYWIVFAQLAAPIRAQLSALIFAKALRKKNIKPTRKRTARTENIPVRSSNEAEASNAASRVVESTIEDEEAAKISSQATINLVGVDATRVADFCSMNCFLVNSLFKTVISTCFLIYLIGWRALLAGIVSFTLVIPLTTILTKRYSVAQKALLTARDKKLGIVTEALQGIRQIKFAALERAWEKKISAARAKELGVLWRSLVTAALLECVGLVGPLLFSSVSLTVYVCLNRQLTPSLAFTTLAVFGSLEATISLIPLLITEFVDAKVSTKRINDYLEGPERVYNILPAEDISIREATLAWPSDDVDLSGGVDRRFKLQVANLVFPRGELTVISGQTGSGKSLLLASLIGESELLKGAIRMPQSWLWSTVHNHTVTAETWIMSGKVAFVAQNPWIETMSIRENILFSLPMDKDRYEMTLKACSLKHDLELLSDGDETEIGANGVNLSGGQRWRVALARALYSRAEILVLDDVFSAVDAHVGNWILENALTGPLAKGRTRILATHHVSLVALKARYAIVLAGGTVAAAGPAAENLIELANRSVLSTRDNPNSALKNFEESVDMRGKDTNPPKHMKRQKFIQEEERKSGVISPQIFWNYFKASGGLGSWLLCLLGFFAARLVMLGRSWWVKVWTSSDLMESFMHANASTPYKNNLPAHQVFETFPINEVEEVMIRRPLQYYLIIYFAISVAACLANTLKELYISSLVIKGSKNLFRAMAYKVLRMPLRWIDTIPVGRILNRFTADFNAVDSRMAHDLGSMLSSAVQVLVIVVAGMVVSPLVAVLGIILLCFAVMIAKRYLAAARAVKRLDSVTKSPVFEQFGSTLIGMSTIRAFGNAQVYMDRMYGLIDDYTTTSWNLWLLNRWLSFNIGLIGVIATVAVSVIIVSTKSIDASLAGFALSFTLDFSSAINWTLRRYANTELIMNAVERIHEYSELQPESDDGIDVPAAWPSEGRLAVRDLVAGYDMYSPPVLKGVSFEISANERIGIVGRTGAGKSSLILSIFRFLEARSGSIVIDGLDISKIKLHDLRSRLNIIPQDPGLFAGTIRSNLDPSDHHDDVKLHEALRRVHLNQTPVSNTGNQSGISLNNDTTITNAFENLSSPVSEGGFNLSQGQRQLLCLARALLSRPKIMVLDEATSAVDMQTDASIQRTLREEFTNMTLIVIAHRLSTVVDFDRILVMSNGAVEEFDSPRQLMAKKGAYWRMVQESGES